MVFAGAGDAVCQWRVQLGAGLQVSASAPTAVAGAVVILGLGVQEKRPPCFGLDIGSRQRRLPHGRHEQGADQA